MSSNSCVRSTFVQSKLLQKAISFYFELFISLNAHLVSEQEVTTASNWPTKEYRSTVKSSKEKKSSWNPPKAAFLCSAWAYTSWSTLAWSLFRTPVRAEYHSGSLFWRPTTNQTNKQTHLLTVPSYQVFSGESFDPSFSEGKKCEDAFLKCFGVTERLQWKGTFLCPIGFLKSNRQNTFHQQSRFARLFILTRQWRILLFCIFEFIKLIYLEERSWMR